MQPGRMHFLKLGLRLAAGGSKEAGLRPPERGSSHLNGDSKKGGDARAWIDNPLPTRSKECEEDRTNNPGPLLHGSPGGRQVKVWCGDSLDVAP